MKEKKDNMATTKSTTNKGKNIKPSVSAEKTIEAKENKIENIEATEALDESPIVSYKAKKSIPMDALVMVKSAVNGKLVYVSKRQTGYMETWNGLGEEIPMEMAELYSMKNTDRSFFTENWIEVDPIVLRDLQMERFYKDSISVSDLDSIFELENDKLKQAINKMKENTKNAFALEAVKRVENGTLTNFKTISIIEELLNCELYEH